jgi:alpha-L-arabinofuranosidase
LPVEASINLPDAEVIELKETTLAGDDITAHNTFDDPSRVTPRSRSIDVKGKWSQQFPAASVTVFTARIR